MKKKKKLSAFDFFNYIFMICLLAIVVYPLYYTVIVSFSDANAVATGKVRWLPVGFTTVAYKHVFVNKEIWRGYVNTIVYATFGTLFDLLLTIPTAYVLSKKRLPGRGIFMTFFMITMYFGGGMVPTYMLIKKLGLLNTRWVLIITDALSVYNLIVARTFFATSISESLYEAADIDGAGEFKKMFSIAMPLSKPIIAVLALYYGVRHWNTYFNALLYISNKKLEPLQSVLRRILLQNEDALNEMLLLTENAGIVDDINVLIQNAAQRAYLAYTMKYAVVFIASAPLLIAYPFVQKYFVKGVMIGAVKE